LWRVSLIMAKDFRLDTVKMLVVQARNRAAIMNWVSDSMPVCPKKQWRHMTNQMSWCGRNMVTRWWNKLNADETRQKPHPRSRHHRTLRLTALNQRTHVRRSSSTGLHDPTQNALADFNAWLSSSPSQCRKQNWKLNAMVHAINNVYDWLWVIKSAKLCAYSVMHP